MIFERCDLDAQAAKIPLGIDGDDGQRIHAVKDILIRNYLVNLQDNSHVHIKCGHVTIEFQQ